MQSDPQGRNSVYEGAGQSWHAIYTRHQHEKAIAGMLSAKDFEVFLPLYRALHRWKDRSKTILLPLFPCYVFVWGGLERRHQVLRTPGVWSIVGCEGRPAPIPASEIEAIRLALETHLNVEPYPYLKRGSRVRVIGGPLAGIEGILVRQKGSGRLVLSVELLQKSVAVEIGIEAVEQIQTPVWPGLRLDRARSALASL